MKCSKIFLKFFAVLALLMTLSMSILTIFFIAIFKDRYEEVLLTNSQESVRKMINQVSNNLDEMISYSQIISFNEDVQYTLENITQDESAYQYYFLVQNVKNTLKEYVSLRSNFLYDIVIISKDGTPLEMNNNYKEFFASEPSEVLYEEDKYGFIPPRSYTYHIQTGPWNTFCYVSNVYSKNDYKYIGELMLVMKYNSIIEQLLDFDDSLGISISLYDGDDTLMYPQNTGKDYKEEYGYILSGEKNAVYENAYYFYEETSLKGWYSIYCISGDYIQQTLNHLFAALMAILFTSIMVLLVVTYRLIKNMFRPLESIIHAMRKVSHGEKNVQVDIQTGDEIEEAANVFNSMVIDIQTNTQKLIDSQRRENETQIRMLIYQINPHFIYNTLNCVICLARGRDNEKIIILVRTLIELLRSTLKGDVEAHATVLEEKEYIDRYIDVLRYSYRNIPEINWQIDEGLENEKILKQILYPLVENSVFHGILSMEEEGEISIIIERNGDYIEVTEYDNGRGMTAEQLEALRGTLHNVTKEIIAGEHIGLQNVNNRLNVVYGPESRICIESRMGKGTLIRFRYPAC